MAKGNPPTPGSKYRIKVGQTITGICWSNAATTIKGFWTIVYDDGEPDYWPIVESASGSSRAAVLWSTGQLAKKNGWVVGGVAGGGGTFQRGQLYHQVLITDVNLSVSSEVIACGYAYAGHLVEFGTFVEPGPAGGAGNMRDIALTDPAANVEFAQTSPTGAVWLLRSLSVQLVQGITQTPLPALRMDGPLGKIAQIPAMTTALGASTTAQLTWGIGLTLEQFLAVVGDEMYTAPLPVVYLNVGDTFGSITDGIGANTNYGAAVVRVEEWVMPN